MGVFWGARWLLLVTASSISAISLLNSSIFLHSSSLISSADVMESTLDRAAGQGASDNVALLEPGSTPRRLSFSAALINFATQVATSEEIRQLVGQWTSVMGEIFKGPDTSESNISHYWKVPECVVTVDFASVSDVGVADASKVTAVYTPVHNAIMLAYVEESPEWIQVLKRPLGRVQFVHVPAECMVDENTTFSTFCMKPKGKCLMVRLDFNLTKITRQMMNPLQPISARAFIQMEMEEGTLYDDAVDILEAPTTVGRMLFDPLRCIMHTRVQAMGSSRIYLYHNPLDHSLRVDAQNTDNSWFRRKVILPLGCGGSETKDFLSVVHLQPDGHYKVIIKTPIARGTDHDRTAPDNIRIEKGEEIRPINELKFGEHDPKNLYPHANYIPIETMVVGHPF